MLTGSDLLEQQQSIEQARLLDRFKQLREWQATQQDNLMRQQQQQMEMLKEEQEKVQKLIAKQRQQSWGAPSAMQQPVVTGIGLLILFLLTPSLPGELYSCVP